MNQAVFNRLRRVEGQVRGLEKMIEEEREFSEIIIQLQATKSALSGIIIQLIEERVVTTEEGLNLSADDLSTLIRLLKSH